MLDMGSDVRGAITGELVIPLRVFVELVSAI
jgi:hypothetical protein